AHARLVHLTASLRHTRAHDFDGPRMVFQRDAERFGDTFGGDVVMGRADSAGREQIGVTRPQSVHRGNDRRLLVGDDADFFQIDADVGQKVGDVADILILGAAGKDFVPDYKNGGGHNAVVFGRAAG